MSKGSKKRPLSIPIEKFGENYDHIFRKKPAKPKETKVIPVKAQDPL